MCNEAQQTSMKREERKRKKKERMTQANGILITIVFF
jgi:hypothetical protein